MKTYTVRIACEVAGQWRTPDVPFVLTDEQARYIAPPYGNVVTPYVTRPAVGTVQPMPTMVTREDNGLQHRNERQDRRAAQRLGGRQAVNREDTDDADR